MALSSSYELTQRAPGESQFTCATQLRASSIANSSAYQVEPA